MFEISGIGIFTVFAAGFISFLSPCVLPLVPGYLSFIAGKSLAEIDAETDYRSTTRALYLEFPQKLGIQISMAFSSRATPGILKNKPANRYLSNAHAPVQIRDRG